MVLSKNLCYLYSFIGKFLFQLFFDRTAMATIFCRYICFVLLPLGFLLVDRKVFIKLKHQTNANYKGFLLLWSKVENLCAIHYVGFVDFCETLLVFILVLFIDKLSCELLFIFRVLHFSNILCDQVFLVTV